MINKKSAIGKEYMIIGILMLFIVLIFLGWYLKTNRVEVFVAGAGSFEKELKTEIIGGMELAAKNIKSGEPVERAGNAAGTIQEDAAAAPGKPDKDGFIDYTVHPGQNMELININTADKDELIKLNGIGNAKAEAIIEYRQKNGYFKSIDEIKNVKGIGEATFLKIKDHIKVETNTRTDN